MGLKKEIDSALARFRSASGHISVEIPKIIEHQGQTINLRDAVSRHRRGDLPDEEKAFILDALNTILSGAEDRIRRAASSEEIEGTLALALGSRRAVKLLGSSESGDELEDARRWLRYTRKLK